MLCAVVLFNLWAVTCFSFAIADDEWTLTFDNSNVKQFEMGSSTNISFYAYTNSTWQNEDLKVQMISFDENVAYTSHKFIDLPRTNLKSSINLTFSFNLTTEFIGYTKLQLQVLEMSELIIILVVPI